ncbi:MAG: glycosyl hydrolase family 18 protein [Cellulosilyticaceae bacterium]
MEKKQKLILCGLFLAIGIIIGLVTGTLLSKVGGDTKVVKKTEAVVTPSKVLDENFVKVESVEDNGKLSGEADEIKTSSEGQWREDGAYNGGEQVEFEGVFFEAKWWTQGEKPDKNNEWGAWRVLGVRPIEEITEQTVIPEVDPIKRDGFKVVGYFPSWKPQGVGKIQYDKLTHINYAFAIPSADGGLLPLENEETAKEIIKKAHEKGVKVLLAVGGWEYQGVPLENTFVQATDTDEKCKKLATEIVNVVEQYGFDGVDMDWEHPRTDGNSKNQYAALMKYLNEALDKKGKLLTSAVLAGVSADGWEMWDAAAHTDEVLECVDWINVMAYDGGDGDRHSTFEFAMSSSNYWLTTRGVPGHKIVLGVPFYGRPSWNSYEEILALDSSASSKDHVNQIYYNGINTIKSKTNWAQAHLGGVMIWELTQDTTNQEKSLLNAIYEEVYKGQ